MSRQPFTTGDRNPRVGSGPGVEGDCSPRAALGASPEVEDVLDEQIKKTALAMYNDLRNLGFSVGDIIATGALVKGLAEYDMTHGHYPPKLKPEKPEP